MNKETIGLIIILIIAIVSISGCTDNNSSLNNNSGNNSTNYSEEDLAVIKAELQFLDDNPDIEFINMNLNKTEVVLTTYDGVEVYKVTLAINGFKPKNGSMIVYEEPEYSVYYVDLDTGNIISS
ncbi:MAG: hypothetical protein FWH29_06390 [Methanobrevibacter sp.]|nr:hypothetical protein [Methanobrevibacter sp.]